MYSNIFLFTTAYFHFLIYNINMTFSPTLTYSNLFHFKTASFHFLIHNINIIFSPTLTLLNLLFFTTDIFTPMWYVRIKVLIGGVTCCLTCLGCLIYKTGFFWRRPRDVSSFLLFLAFFLCSDFQFPLNSASSLKIN